MNSAGTTEHDRGTGNALDPGRDPGRDPRRATGPPGRITRLAASRWVVAPTLIVATILLVSMGGAIIAAPITLPLLVAIAMTRTGPARVLAAVLAALTFGEVVWLLTYVVGGEAQPWIWLVPLIGGLTLAWWVLRRRERHRPDG